jgi:hypothetical protein
VIGVPLILVPIRASQCTDLEVLTAPEYYRGKLGNVTGAYEYVNACWLRGMMDARPKPETATATCAAGSHAVAHGGCCKDGTHEGEIDTGKCIPDGSHDVGGGKSCQNGSHSSGGDKCSPD